MTLGFLATFYLSLGLLLSTITAEYTIEYYCSNGAWRLAPLFSYGLQMRNIIADIPIDRSLKHDKFGWGDEYATKPRIKDIINKEFLGNQTHSWIHINLWSIGAPPKV